MYLLSFEGGRPVLLTELLMFPKYRWNTCTLYLAMFCL